MNVFEFKQAMLDYSGLIRSLGGFETAMKNPKASQKLKDDFGRQIQYLREVSIPAAILQISQVLGGEASTEEALKRFVSSEHSLFGEKG